MTAPSSILAACIVALASGTGVIANETTHGGMAIAMGFGHHQLAAAGSHDCDHNATPTMHPMHDGTMDQHPHCAGTGLHGDHHNETMRGTHG